MNVATTVNKANPITKKYINPLLDGFRTRGPAYKYLQNFSEAIEDLQTSWFKNHPASIRYFSLQGIDGDYIVDDKSSYSLKNMAYLRMDRVFHTAQADTPSWQEVIYLILCGKVPYRINQIQDLRAYKTDDWHTVHAKAYDPKIYNEAKKYWQSQH